MRDPILNADELVLLNSQWYAMEYTRTLKSCITSVQELKQIKLPNRNIAGHG